jgi:hypothetical protein
MNEVHQLASALLTIVFAAVMFVVGHLYIENKSTRIPTVQAFVPWTNPCKNPWVNSRDQSSSGCTRTSTAMSPKLRRLFMRQRRDYTVQPFRAPIWEVLPDLGTN